MAMHSRLVLSLISRSSTNQTHATGDNIPNEKEGGLRVGQYQLKIDHRPNRDRYAITGPVVRRLVTNRVATLQDGC
jgi:hypothetical protein